MQLNASNLISRQLNSPLFQKLSLVEQKCIRLKRCILTRSTTFVSNYFPDPFVFTEKYTKIMFSWVFYGFLHEIQIFYFFSKIFLIIASDETSTRNFKTIKGTGFSELHAIDRFEFNFPSISFTIISETITRRAKMHSTKNMYLNMIYNFCFKLFSTYFCIY